MTTRSRCCNNRTEKTGKDSVADVARAKARATACRLCNGQTRPTAVPLYGPIIWKCDRCGNEQTTIYQE